MYSGTVILNIVSTLRIMTFAAVRKKSRWPPFFGRRTVFSGSEKLSQVSEKFLGDCPAAFREKPGFCHYIYSGTVILSIVSTLRITVLTETQSASLDWSTVSSSPLTRQLL